MAACLLSRSRLLYFSLLPQHRLARAQADEKQGSGGPQTSAYSL